MKKSFSEICAVQLFIYLIILSLFSCSQEEQEKPENENFENFDIKKGVNIAHWLSQTDVRGEQRRKNFTKKEVEHLSGLGFDHLRLPVDEEQLFTESNELDGEVVGLIHNFISWCHEYDMKVILDMHILRSHHFDDEDRPLWTDLKEQDKFVDMWLTINKEFHTYSEKLLAFELLNEVVAPTNSDWNKLAGRAISELRKVSFSRKIVLGANHYNSITEMENLEIPKNDRNIILSFHFYEPFPLTHYHASWTVFSNFSVPTYYPGQLVGDDKYKKLLDNEKQIYAPYKDIVYDRAELKKRVGKAKLVAEKYNLQLYCGEFGCVSDADNVSRYAWWSDIVFVLDEYNIAYTTWGYKGSFGFLNNDDGTLKDEKLQSILLNKKK